MDWAEEVLKLIREAAEGRKVYDGQPDEKLEDRPDVHVIVDIHVPQIEETTVAPTFDREVVQWQIRVIVRSGAEYTRDDAAWAARWTSRKIRDYLIRRRLRPGGELISQELEDGMVDDQAIVSHSTAIEVTQYRAKV